MLPLMQQDTVRVAHVDAHGWAVSLVWQQIMQVMLCHTPGRSHIDSDGVIAVSSTAYQRAGHGGDGDCIASAFVHKQLGYTPCGIA